MARTKLVEVTIPSGRAVGGVDHITVPFQPQGAALFWNGRSDVGNGQGRASHRRGVGLWTPTTARCHTSGSEDNHTPSLSRSQNPEAPALVELLSGNALTLGASSGGAAIDNGDGTWSIPLTCTTAYTQAVCVAAWAFGDLTGCDYAAGTLQNNPIVIPTPSGAGDALILVSTPNTSVSSGEDSAFGLGIAAKAGGQAAIAGDSNSGSNPAVANGAGSLSAALLSWNGAATSLPYQGAVTLWDADHIEVTLNATSAAAVQWFALVLVGCSASVQTIPLPDTVQTESQITDLSFEAAGGLVIAPRQWDTGGATHSNDQTSIGAFDHDGAQAALSVVDVKGQSPTVVATSLRHGDCFVRQSEGAAPANAAALTLKSIDPTTVSFLTTIAGDGGAAPAVLLLGPDTSGPPPLTGGTATLASISASAVTASATDATGGTAPYSYQWQRSPAGAGTWADLAGQTTRSLNDTTVVAGTAYDWRLAYTDSAASPATVTSNTITATAQDPGGGGAGFDAAGFAIHALGGLY